MRTANVIEADKNKSGYEAFTMFGAEGSVRWLVNDEDSDRYVGFYRNEQPLPTDNDYHLTLDEYLFVIEGGISIKFLPDGERLDLGPGDMAFLPGDSHINLTLTKLPYEESFVMIPRDSDA
jgi:ethanolamine utilization protein EutQ (cupin superfamily)